MFISIRQQQTNFAPNQTNKIVKCLLDITVRICFPYAADFSCGKMLFMIKISIFTKQKFWKQIWSFGQKRTSIFGRNSDF